jgi:hypothetical protein
MKDHKLNYLHDDKNIDGILIFTECPGNEAIIVGIHNGRVQNTVNLNIKHKSVVIKNILSIEGYT